MNNAVYSLNSILPDDIVIKRIREVASDAHARFDATSREYTYHIYRGKNPFISDRAYYYPYKLDLELLNEAATILKEYDDFTSFSKRNTQVKTFICQLTRSYWESKGDRIIYTVEGNRFLRGMVRGLVGTMLRVGTGKLSLDGFRGVIEGKDASKADFSVPGHGLFLMEVKFPYPVS